jgi:SacI restriction endonuclease
VTGFISKHRLPCNSTTAFLTPGFRTFNRVFTEFEPTGRPKELYTRLFHILNTVSKGHHSAKAVLTDALRNLIDMRNERLDQLERLQASLKQSAGLTALSTEEIVTLLRQHLECRGSSRLPVLMIAAAYDSVGERFGETRKPLHAHTAADEQTGSFGDVEIVVVNDERICTAYEMKQKRVTVDDIDRAIQKMGNGSQRIDNYLFVTTDHIESVVEEYARVQFDKIGSEVAIVDCLGFLRHFLHWFHRYRIVFLNAYQALLLAEPDSAVSVPLKSAFLSLRQAAEAEA